jgi:predicted negative regulator of RcsB-dependent stress response
MDEDLEIINSNTRNEKIKNFFLKNKKKLILILTLIILLLISFFSYSEYKYKKKIKISDLYNFTIIEYSQNTETETKNNLIDIIKKKDPTYSPLSLYFIIDNKLVSDRKKVNELFDIVIKEISLDKEIKNLLIYKKALYNADDSNESQLLKILNPIINSESVWKSHALYLMAEFFYANNEKQKSKEFFNQILSVDNANQDLIIATQKRLNRDLSE